MDLEAVKGEISRKKKIKLEEDIALGNVSEQQGVAPMSKDMVLYELQRSLTTGVATATSEAIIKVDQMVENRSNNKISGGGGGLSQELSNHGVGGTTAPQIPQAPTQMGNERDDLFNRKLNEGQIVKTNSGGLSQELAQHQQQPLGMPPQMGQPYPPQQQPYPPQQQYQQQYIPPQNNTLVEQVNSAISNYNFQDAIQEAMKSVIIDMYGLDKMKKSLLENKDMIKKIVRDTLIELSNASPKK